MFIFLSGRNYGSYLVTPKPAMPMTFEDRFQHTFKEIGETTFDNEECRVFEERTENFLSDDYRTFIERHEQRTKDREKMASESGFKVIIKDETLNEGHGKDEFLNEVDLVGSLEAGDDIFQDQGVLTDDVDRLEGDLNSLSLSFEKAEGRLLVGHGMDTNSSDAVGNRQQWESGSPLARPSGDLGANSQDDGIEHGEPGGPPATIEDLPQNSLTPAQISAAYQCLEELDKLCMEINQADEDPEDGLDEDVGCTELNPRALKSWQKIEQINIENDDDNCNEDLEIADFNDLAEEQTSSDVVQQLVENEDEAKEDKEDHQRGYEADVDKESMEIPPLQKLKSEDMNESRHADRADSESITEKSSQQDDSARSIIISVNTDESEGHINENTIIEEIGNGQSMGKTAEESSIREGELNEDDEDLAVGRKEDNDDDADRGQRTFKRQAGKDRKKNVSFDPVVRRIGTPEAGDEAGIVDEKMSARRSLRDLEGMLSKSGGNGHQQTPARTLIFHTQRH